MYWCSGCLLCPLGEIQYHAHVDGDSNGMLNKSFFLLTNYHTIYQSVIGYIGLEIWKHRSFSHHAFLEQCRRTYPMFGYIFSFPTVFSPFFFIVFTLQQWLWRAYDYYGDYDRRTPLFFGMDQRTGIYPNGVRNFKFHRPFTLLNALSF